MKKAAYIGKILLLLLFAGYYGELTFYAHVHRSGTTFVVHSHPYQGSASGHTHTSDQLQHLPQPGHFLLLVPAVACSLRVFRRRIAILAEKVRQLCLFPVAHHYLLRAPPACGTNTVCRRPAGKIRIV